MKKTIEIIIPALTIPAQTITTEIEIPDAQLQAKETIESKPPGDTAPIPVAPAPSPGNPTNTLEPTQPSHPLPLRVEAENPPKPQHSPATLAKLVAVVFCVSALAVLLFSCGGCATPIVAPPSPAQTNAVTGIVSPPQPAVTNYVPNATLAQITPAVQAAAPFIPAPYNAILLALLGLATAVSTAIAANKTNTATTQTNAAAALAATINAQPQSPIPGTTLTPIQHAMTMAATNGTTAAVAVHLANAASPT
jgi:hypothetical protein